MVIAVFPIFFYGSKGHGMPKKQHHTISVIEEYGGQMGIHIAARTLIYLQHGYNVSASIYQI
jgi:hypothetical protein